MNWWVSKTEPNHSIFSTQLSTSHSILRCRGKPQLFSLWFSWPCSCSPFSLPPLTTPWLYSFFLLSFFFSTWGALTIAIVTLDLSDPAPKGFGPWSPSLKRTHKRSNNKKLIGMACYGVTNLWTDEIHSTQISPSTAAVDSKCCDDTLWRGCKSRDISHADFQHGVLSSVGLPPPRIFFPTLLYPDQCARHFTLRRTCARVRRLYPPLYEEQNPKLTRSTAGRWWGAWRWSLGIMYVNK